MGTKTVATDICIEQESILLALGMFFCMVIFRVLIINILIGFHRQREVKCFFWCYVNSFSMFYLRTLCWYCQGDV